MVTVRGKVIDQINGKDADEHIDKLSKKYLGRDKNILDERQAKSGYY
jgi:hypothetical protein